MRVTFLSVVLVWNSFFPVSTGETFTKLPEETPEKIILGPWKGNSKEIWERHHAQATKQITREFFRAGLSLEGKRFEDAVEDRIYELIGEKIPGKENKDVPVIERPEPPGPLA